MSNAWSWLLLHFSTEANTICQFHNKYQIAWQDILEIQTHDGEKMAMRLMHCQREAGTAGVFYVCNQSLDFSWASLSL